MDPELLEVVGRGAIRPLRRAEYDQLVAQGAFEDERIELLDGWLVEMSPVGYPHCQSQRLSNTLLVPRLLGRAYVQMGLPVALSELSEPQPDIAVVPLGEYKDDHPERVLLAIECAESSLRRDTELKARLYARAGIEDYWVLDLDAHEVIVHREPDPVDGAYLSVFRVGREARLSLLAFPDVVLDVAAFLP